jgi:hypothetical protein
MKIIFQLVVLVALLATAMAASAREYSKFTDQNGVAFWVDDKSKLPPPFPVCYRYVDKNGVVFWERDQAKIPAEYRSSATLNYGGAESGSATSAVPKGQPRVTSIRIVDNQIIVPVVFKNKRRTVKANMILDTGASVTTLYSKLAADLRLNKNKHKKVRSVSANGASTTTRLTRVDAIEVDGKKHTKSEVLIMPHSNIGADGLLGNSYLRHFSFTIDYEKQLLRWN